MRREEEDVKDDMVVVNALCTAMTRWMSNLILTL
jgi:hypothetical protein